MVEYKLYGSPLSQPTRAVMWLLTYLDIPFTFVPVDASKGEHRTSDFLSLNPNAKFPVLVTADEKYVIHESHAIVRYICRKYPNDLYKGDDELLGRIDSWLDWKHSYLRPGAAGLVRRNVMVKLMKDPSQHSMVQDFKEILPEREVRLLIESLDLMESVLAKNSENGKKGFLCGEVVTVADLVLATEVEQLKMLAEGKDVPEGRELNNKWPNVAKWLKDVEKLKGFDKSHDGLIKACVGIDKMRSKGAKL